MAAAASAGGEDRRVGRWVAALAVAAGLLVILALGPAQAQAQACGKARKAGNVKVYGVSCSQGKRVVAEDVSRHKCRNRCSFQKVGYGWSCVQRPSGLNSCETHVGTKRYTVTFDYKG